MWQDRHQAYSVRRYWYRAFRRVYWRNRVCVEFFIWWNIPTNFQEIVATDSRMEMNVGLIVETGVQIHAVNKESSDSELSLSFNFILITQWELISLVFILACWVLVIFCYQNKVFIIDHSKFERKRHWIWKTIKKVLFLLTQYVAKLEI